MAYQKPVKLFLIKDKDTGKYLVYRDQLLQLRKGYFWKEGKAGAAMVDRKKADVIIRLLKGSGFFNLERKLVRKWMMIMGL